VIPAAAATLVSGAPAATARRIARSRSSRASATALRCPASSS